MRRERTLKIVLAVVGLLFCAGVYPLTMFFSREPAVPMIMSIYDLAALNEAFEWVCPAQVLFLPSKAR